MEFDSVIEKRKSVRAFKSTGASWKDVLKAIDAANQAPFAGNQNHLKFIIIEDEEMIKKISQQSNQDWISKASIVVAVCSDDLQLEKMYGERGRVYSRQQAGAAIENFLLKMVDSGLSACWVGSFDDNMIRILLRVPSHIQIEALIPIGHEDFSKTKTKEPVRKKALDTTIYWEAWNTNKRPTIFGEAPERGPRHH